MTAKRSVAPNPDDLLRVARVSLAAYAPLLYPNYKVYKHHSLLIDKLEGVASGKIKRLMISMPPRMGKSLTCTELFPAWYLGKNPSKSVIVASYSQEFVEGFGRKIRNFVADPRTTSVFPELRMAEDSTSMKRFDTTAGGSLFAVGRGGATTGRGGDLIIVDDPLKDSDEAHSDTIRKQLHEWFTTVLYTRKQPDTAIVIISTRWHFDDLTGWLLKEHPEENWDTLTLAAISETDEGWRPEGAPLWPQRFPLNELERTKRMLGTYGWSALYQQRPVPEEGAIFKTEWWQRWSELPEFTRIVVSADTAFKAKRSSDYSVFTAWGEAKNGFYLLDMWRARAEFPALKRELVRFSTQWSASVVLVEDAASGQSLIQELREGTTLPVIPTKVDTDKVSRAHACSPLVEAAKVFIPSSADWLADFLYELATFPAGSHDDIVDSVTQALNWMRGSNLTYGLFEFYAQTQAEIATGGVALVDGQLAAKPEPTASALTECPSCVSTCVQRLPGRQWRCGSCGVQWGAPVEAVSDGQRLPGWRM